MDQKMMKTLGMVIAGFVVFIFVLFLFASCTKKKYSYEKLENKMVEITKNYFKNNEKELPQQDKDTRSYTLKKMISDGKIDELSKLFNDENIKCDGSVTVTNNNGHYVYTPTLNCGKDYHTKTLKDVIIENSLTDVKGAGLYEVGDQYIFKGEVKNNYVSFDGKTFRIIRINDDGSIRLIDQNGLSEVYWDTKYNSDVQDSNGINEYHVTENLYANIKQVCDNYYNNSKVWSDDARQYIITQDLCIGKRAKLDASHDGSTECAVKLEGQLFGALSTYEYLQASMDDNCTNTTHNSCVNFNWFTSIKNRFWTVTGEEGKSDHAYVVYKKPISTLCSSQAYLNVVFNIHPNVVYVSGDGTADSPYVFK